MAITACSSTSTPAPAATTVTATAPAASTSAAPPSPAADLTAAGIVTALQQAGVPISSPIIYTAETDPNHKLGRPGGYTGKAAWTDTRIQATDARDRSPGAVDLGGGVETFASAEEAQARGKFIQAALQGSQLDNEYDYLAGGVLLRLSAVLTPTQAQEYATALGKITGTQATAITK